MITQDVRTTEKPKVIVDWNEDEDSEKVDKDENYFAVCAICDDGGDVTLYVLFYIRLTFLFVSLVYVCHLGMDIFSLLLFTYLFIVLRHTPVIVAKSM